MNRRAGLWLIATLAQGACVVHSHVRLPAAPTRGTLVERDEAYRRYRPASMTEVSVTHTYNGIPGRSYSFADGMQLANGETVVFPEDLLPMVDSRSATAIVAREHRASQRLADGLAWSALASLGVGLALTSIAVVPALTGAWREPNVPTLVTGGGFLLLSPVFLIANANPRWRATQLRKAAYERYDDSLRRNLGMCGAGAPYGPCPPENLSPPQTQSWDFSP